MAEWLKAYAWKAYILQKGIEGSNPSLSASSIQEGEPGQDCSTAAVCGPFSIIFRQVINIEAMSDVSVILKDMNRWTGCADGTQSRNVFGGT